jgi:hypothetical protein
MMELSRRKAILHGATTLLMLLVIVCPSRHEAREPKPDVLERPAQDEAGPSGNITRREVLTREAMAAEEAEYFKAVCSEDGSSSLGACIIRGRVRSRYKAIVPEGGWFAAGAIHAYVVEIEQDDSFACSTPLDGDAKADQEREASWAHHGRYLTLFGAARIATELTPGRSLCGWSKVASIPGLPTGEPDGYEGELAIDGKPFAAWSGYFVADDSRRLARDWGLARGGVPRVNPIPEGGAFLEHDAIRVAHGKASVQIDAGVEGRLESADGPFWVRAKSFLTFGQTPVFVGKWDGYRFSALRIPEEGFVSNE